MDPAAIAAITDQTLREVTKTIAEEGAALRKDISESTGLVGTPLWKPAQQLVALMSPFNATIPRIARPGRDSVLTRRITSLSNPKLSATETTAGSLFSTTVVNSTDAFKHSALRGKVTRSAIAQSQGFDDALNKETANTLLLAKKLEEVTLLGGNITGLSAPTSLAVAERDAKGTIGAVTVYVRVAAVTLHGALTGTTDRPADYDGTDAILAGSNKTTPVVTASGYGIGPLATEVNSGAMTGTDNGAKITWDAVPGAAAYLIFAGTSTGDANLKLQAMVTQTSITLSSLGTTGTAASTLVDTSADADVYDGIIPILAAGGAGYLKDVSGKLTGSNGEILELQDAFQAIWDTAKIGKFRVQVAGLDSRVLTRLGIAAGGGPTIFVDPAAGPGRFRLVQGYHVGSVVNGVTGDVCPVDTLPWLSGGTILILPTEIPFPDANVSAPFDWQGAYDWERQDYFQTSSSGPVKEFDIRNWGVLRANFPGGCGVLYNIFKG